MALSFCRRGHQHSLRKDGRRFCRVCSNDLKREAYQNDPEKFKKRTKINRAKGLKYSLSENSKAKNKERYLIRRYGLTPEQKRAMLEEQQGLCLICESLPCKKGLVVDHSHKEFIVRGLLCNSCNLGLGKFKDSAKILRAAAKYLEVRG